MSNQNCVGGKVLDGQIPCEKDNIEEMYKNIAAGVIRESETMITLQECANQAVKENQFFRFTMNLSTNVDIEPALIDLIPKPFKRGIMRKVYRTLFPNRYWGIVIKAFASSMQNDESDPYSALEKKQSEFKSPENNLQDNSQWILLDSDIKPAWYDPSEWETTIINESDEDECDEK